MRRETPNSTVIIAQPIGESSTSSIKVELIKGSLLSITLANKIRLQCLECNPRTRANYCIKGYADKAAFHLNGANPSKRPRPVLQPSTVVLHCGPTRPTFAAKGTVRLSELAFRVA